MYQTTQSNVVVKGDGTAGVTIGNATDTAGGELNRWIHFQIADSYATVVANLSGAIVDGTKAGHPPTPAWNDRRQHAWQHQLHRLCFQTN